MLIIARKLKVLPPSVFVNIFVVVLFERRWFIRVKEDTKRKIQSLSQSYKNLQGEIKPRKTSIMVLCQNDAGKKLTTAAAKGNASEVLRLLEECRIHPDTVNEYGKTSLQVMMMGNSTVASLLLEHGADPNIQDKHGVTAAHDAARTGFLDTLRVLVDSGASVNSPDQAGALPIHIAIREGHLDVVEFLAPRSDLKHPNTSGHTAMDVARASCAPDVVELLERQLKTCVLSHSA